MKILALFLLALGICSNALAQAFAIINDADGFVNVRKEPNAKSKIRGKVYKGDIFHYDAESKADWIEIYRQDNKNNGLEGYIHKSKLLPLSKLRKITKVDINNNKCVASNDSIRLEITSAKFIAKKHRLKYETCKDCSYNLHYIDGKPFWGADGGVPRIQIQSVKLSQNGQMINIPQNTYTDLFEPNFETLRFYFGNRNTIYIQMNNSDGAGGYSVIWVIKDGKYLKRYIDDSFA